MSLFIPGPAGPLEAALWEPDGGTTPRALCALCHPHPERGGDMHSTVVFRAARGLLSAGLAVLRFNFRGVGQSAGGHGGQGEEETDLEAVLDHLGERWPGAPLWAGGFSFGARVTLALAAEKQVVERVLLLAVPVLAFDCQALARLQTPGLILQAGEDTFGGVQDLRRCFPHLDSGLQIDEIKGADHFFNGRSSQLEQRVKLWATQELDPNP